MAQSSAVKGRSRPFIKLTKNSSHFNSFNPIQDFCGQNSPPSYYIFHVTSTNVGISLQNFLTSQIIELEPRSPFKTCGFSGQILMELRFS